MMAGVVEARFTGDPRRWARPQCAQARSRGTAHARCAIQALGYIGEEA
jgi:hypothetical protein